MKRHLALLVSVLMLGGFASAQSIETENDFSAAVNPPADARPVSAQSACAQVKLTDAQKAQIKDAFTQFETAKVTLDANVKLARIAYFKAVGATETAATAAQSMTANLTDAMSKSIEARANFKTQVLFTILTPEQRLPALKCEMSHRKHRRSHGKGHGHKKGQQQGQRGGQRKQKQA